MQVRAISVPRLSVVNISNIIVQYVQLPVLDAEIRLLTTVHMASLVDALWWPTAQMICCSSCASCDVTVFETL